MTDAKARFVIAALAFALRDNDLPSRITDRQTNKQHTTNGRFSKSAFDFTFDDGTRVWGQATSNSVTAYVDSTSQKVSMDYQGEGSATKVTRAEDEKNNAIYSQLDFNGQTLVVNGSLGRFEYYI